MKVCDVVQFHSHLGGGVKRYIEDKMRFFSRAEGIQHFIMVPSRSNAVRRFNGARVYEIKSPPLIGSRSYRMLLARKRILEIVDREKPDIIETDAPYRSAWVALEASRRSGATAVAFYHSDYPRALNRTLRRYLGKTCQGVLSWKIEQYLLRLYNRMDTTVVSTKRFAHVLTAMGVRNVRHVRLGTDPEIFHPRGSGPKIMKEFGLTPETMLLLYVGRLGREKNIRSLLSMMGRFDEGDGPVHLILVGDGELREEVRRHSRLRPDITWLRYCRTSDRLAELYSAADLFVHVGTSETFGLVALEAQACGTRVLGVRGGGLEEALQYERRSVMARDATPESLVEGVRNVRRLGETDQRREARRKKIVEHFPYDRTYQQLLALYQSLCNGKPSEHMT